MIGWGNIVIQGVLIGGLYAMFAAGLALIFGVMRLVNIAHGDLIIVAAYMAYFVMMLTGVGPFVALILILPVVAVMGYVLQRGLLNLALGDAFELTSGRRLTFWVEPELQHAKLAGLTPPCAGCIAARIDVRGR